MEKNEKYYKLILIALFVSLCFVLFGCEPDESICECETRVDGITTEIVANDDCTISYSYYVTSLGTVIEFECSEL